MPVPLTDIEAAHHQPEFGDWDTDDRFCHECSERWPCPTTALCEALRIAVEGLTRVGRNNHSDVAADALAAVRELVDLGEKP